MATFAERLKQLRKENHFTQQQIADKIGVNQGSYANWENGKREPELSTVVELAGMFNCTIDYLLGTKDVNILEFDENDLKKMEPDEISEFKEDLDKNLEQIKKAAKEKFHYSDEKIDIMLLAILKNFIENNKP